MSKLLNKPLKAFTLYALIILACSIPVYYVVIDFIWLSELDEHNQIVKNGVEKRIGNLRLEEAELNRMIIIWNGIQPGMKLIPIAGQAIQPERVYSITKPNEYSGENDVDRFRVLEACLQIHGNTWLLTVETNVEEADETILAIAVVTLLFFSLLVSGFIILNRKISLQIWKPFRSTLEKVKQFDLVNSKPPEFDQSDIEEFEELNAVITKLIQNNKAVYEQQKQFTENASHELQTPLALFKSKLDLLMQDKTLSEYQSESIASLNTAISRISRLNKNMLLLAKLENQEQSGNEVSNVSLILKEHLELHGDLFELGKLSMEYYISDNTTVFVNSNLLGILLSNLIGNVIRHTDRGGKVVVSLTDRILEFSNSGISSLNEKMVFKRFAGVSSEKPGSGLGLAIVKEICANYDWQISYSFKDSMHIFSITF